MQLMYIKKKENKIKLIYIKDEKDKTKHENTTVYYTMKVNTF